MDVGSASPSPVDTQPPPPPVDSAPVDSSPSAGPTQGPSQAPQGQTDSLADHSLVKSGSSGSEVSGLQDKLKKAGYDVGSSGKFDAKTEAAVRQYQKDNNLKVDGKVGQQTWGNLIGQKGLPPGTNMLGQKARNPDPTGRFKDSFEPAGSQRPGASAKPGAAGAPGASAKPGAGGAAPTKNGGTQGPNGAAPTQAPANGSAVDRMLNEARSHLGYHEGAGNSNMFSKGMGRPGEAWCADFVSYVSKKAGLNTVNSAAAQGIEDQLKQQGRWKGRSNPQPGDAITFNWAGGSGRANHVGLVESVFQKNGQTYVRTIEGNSSDQVRRREYPVNSRVIKGFGRIA